ncbi:helix-turn-helix domain-containing protein [Thalassotalea fusca]
MKNNFFQTLLLVEFELPIAHSFTRVLLEPQVNIDQLKPYNIERVSLIDLKTKLSFLKQQKIETVVIVNCLNRVNSSLTIVKDLRFTNEQSPAILALVKDDKLSKQRVLELGATDYLTFPMITPEIQRRVSQQVQLIQLKKQVNFQLSISNQTLPEQTNTSSKLLSEPKSLNKIQIDKQWGFGLKDQLLTYSKEHALAQKTAGYLLENLSQEISLDRLAKQMGTNRTKLTSVFKTSFGQTIISWLREQRMLVAADFLSQSHTSIIEIAEQVGYSDSNNFSTAFKRQFDVSPRQYRLQCRQTNDFVV